MSGNLAYWCPSDAFASTDLTEAADHEALTGHQVQAEVWR